MLKVVVFTTYAHEYTHAQTSTAPSATSSI